MNSILEQLDNFITDLEQHNQQILQENVNLSSSIDVLNKQLASKVDRLPIDVLITALSYMSRNIPYKFGAELDNGGFDCSSFCQQVFKDVGMKLPRVSKDQAKLGTEVKSSILGDLVCIDNNGDGVIDHIGIAITDVLMIHTAGTGENINVCNYQDRYGKKVKTIRRVM